MKNGIYFDPGFVALMYDMKWGRQYVALKKLPGSMYSGHQIGRLSRIFGDYILRAAGDLTYKCAFELVFLTAGYCVQPSHSQWTRTCLYWKSTKGVLWERVLSCMLVSKVFSLETFGHFLYSNYGIIYWTSQSTFLLLLSVSVSLPLWYTFKFEFIDTKTHEI